MTYCHPLDCHTAPVSRSRHRARSAAKLFTLDREGAGATPLPHSGNVATGGKQAGWAQPLTSGPRRSYGRTGASPRDGPGPFGDAGAKGTGTGPLGQPMRPQPRRCAHVPSTASQLRAISCRTASGTGRGAGVTGTGRAHLEPGNHATWAGPIRREAPTCRRTDKQDSGRREAKRERRPADGVGYQRGWARQLTIPERSGDARTAPFPAGPCPAQGAGRVLTDRTFTGGANSARKRHSCRNTQHAAFRPERSAEAGGRLLMLSGTRAQGSCRHRRHCPGHRHALRSRYNPGSDRCTPDPSLPGR